MSKNTDLGNLVNGLFVSSTRNVGVGTTSPTVPLDVVGAGKFTNSGASDELLSINSTFADGYRAILRLNNTHTGGKAWDIYSTNNGDGVYGGGKFVIRNNTDSVNALTITSAGNVGIGTSSPANTNGYTSLTINGTTGSIIELFSNGTRSMQIVSDSSSSYLYGALNTPMMFYTNATERMRITSGGVVLVNQTSISAAGAGQKMQVATDMLVTGPLAGYFFENRTGGVTDSSNWYGWYANLQTVFLYNGSGNIASINPSTGAYTALSDENKKKDFEQSSIGLNEVLQLKPTLYRMKTDDESSRKELGFIAQEVNEFIPQAYVETGEGEDKFIGLNQMPLIAALTKAIQELSAEINILKQK